MTRPGDPTERTAGPRTAPTTYGPAFGHDFSKVRLHAYQTAADLAALLGARAVTLGQQIFFAAGAFEPRTARGQRLLAHELVHVTQHDDSEPPVVRPFAGCAHLLSGPNVSLFARATSTV